MESNNTNINKIAKAITEEDRRAATKDAVAQVERDLEAIKERLKSPHEITNEEKIKGLKTLNEATHILLLIRNQNKDAAFFPKEHSASFKDINNLKNSLSSLKTTEQKTEENAKPGKLEGEVSAKEVGEEQGQKQGQKR